MKLIEKPSTARDRRALLLGGAVIALLLLYLLTRGGSAPPAEETVLNDLSPTIPATPPPSPAVAPQELVAPPVVVAAAPPVDVSQLRLVGLLSRGAVIAMADGSQRFVPVGREIVPGVTLSGIDVHQAILATPSGEVRLGFDSAVQPQAPIVVAPAPQPPVIRRP